MNTYPTANLFYSCEVKINREKSRPIKVYKSSCYLNKYIIQ